MRLTLVAGLAVLAGALAGSAGAGGPLDPLNFDVQMSGGPAMGAPEPSCRQEGEAMLCTSSSSQDLAGARMTGTVTAKAEGLTGAIETTCDMSMRQTMTVRIAAGSGSISLVEASGSGSQRCSWFMSFPEGSSMTGTFGGSMQIAKASDAAIVFRGRMEVVVTAGTGKFADKVGSGTFDEAREFSITGPPASRIVAAALGPAAKPRSQMRIVLRKGEPLARIAAPRGRLTSESAARLRVVSAPGAVCAATAVSGSHRVDLGRVRDTNRNGEVVFPGRLAAALDAGLWRIEASCSYRLGGKAGTARHTAALTVA